MRDFKHSFTSLDQRASATVTVNDFSAGRLTAATGAITVVDYSTIVNAVAATGSITYGVPVDTDTVIVNGNTFTKVAAAPGANEFSTIGELELLVEAVAGVNSSENGTTVSIVAATKGAAGNAITLALGVGNTGTMAISGATLTGGVDGQVLTVDGNALTAGIDFTAETSNDVTAENIKTVVHALANVNATRTNNVVTVTAATAGTGGNAITLVEALTGATVSGATLTGGKDAVVITLDGTALTESTSFNAVTDNATTATNLATALDGVAGFDAVAVGNVVTIYYTTPGTGGNAKTLTTTLATDFAVSGATLAGGVSATYSDTFDYSGEEESQNVETTLNLTAITGTNPTLDVTPQYSYDKSDWFDHTTAFTQRTAAGNQTLDLTTTALFMRFKMVLGGTNPVATGRIFGVAR